MKSHFQRSDGLDACSQLRAGIGRATAKMLALEGCRVVLATDGVQHFAGHALPALAAVETAAIVAEGLRINRDERTSELLEQSQKLTQELQSQSEELKRQQDELRHSNSELEQQAREQEHRGDADGDERQQGAKAGGQAH